MIPGKPHLHRDGQWWVATVYYMEAPDMPWLRDRELGIRGYAYEPSYVSPTGAMLDAAYAAAESAWRICGWRIEYYPMPRRPGTHGLLKEAAPYRRLVGILNRHLADPCTKC